MNRNIIEELETLPNLELFALYYDIKHVIEDKEISEETIFNAIKELSKYSVSGRIFMVEEKKSSEVPLIKKEEMIPERFRSIREYRKFLEEQERKKLEKEKKKKLEKEKAEKEKAEKEKLKRKFLRVQERKTLCKSIQEIVAQVEDPESIFTDIELVKEFTGCPIPLKKKVKK